MSLDVLQEMQRKNRLTSPMGRVMPTEPALERLPRSEHVEAEKHAEAELHARGMVGERELRELLTRNALDRTEADVTGICERFVSMGYEPMMVFCELLHSQDPSKSKEDYAALLFGVSKERLLQRPRPAPERP
jgi:hypothetical protein